MISSASDISLLCPETEPMVLSHGASDVQHLDMLSVSYSDSNSSIFSVISRSYMPFQDQNFVGSPTAVVEFHDLSEDSEISTISSTEMID